MGFTSEFGKMKYYMVGRDHIGNYIMNIALIEITVILSRSRDQISVSGSHVLRSKAGLECGLCIHLKLQ